MTSIIVWLPIAGLAAVLLTPRARPAVAKGVATAAAGVVLAGAVVLAAGFDASSSAPQYLDSRTWIPELGMSYTVGVDGLSMPLILLCTLLVFVAVVSSKIETAPRAFYAWLLLLEFSCLGVFAARDWFLLYVFWEIALVPMFFLIGLWGGPQKARATMAYFLYTLAGSIFMLIGIFAVYLAAEPHTFDMGALQDASRDWTAGFQVAPFLALLAGFAVKIPLFPLHGWLPLAHVQAPTPVSIVLSGVMLKLGAYGLLRAAEILPEGIRAVVPVLFVLGLVNIIYGGFLAFRQPDLKALIAFSSISHMGFVVLGVAALNETGVAGAMLMMVAHGIVTGGLFLLAGLLYQRTKTYDLAEMGGIGRRAPVLRGLLVLALLASMGLPGLAQFPSEVQVLLGAFEVFGLAVLVAAFGILVIATFTLRALGSILAEDEGGRWSGVADLRGGELVAAVPLGLLTVLLGVAPGLAMGMSRRTIETLISGLA
ncbi:MAG: NuoM family protein [Actinomycetota bacterium]